MDPLRFGRVMFLKSDLVVDWSITFFRVYGTKKDRGSSFAGSSGRAVAHILIWDRLIASALPECALGTGMRIHCKKGLTSVILGVQFRVVKLIPAFEWKKVINHIHTTILGI